MIRMMIQAFGFVTLSIGDAPPIQVDDLVVWNDGMLVYEIGRTFDVCWYTGGKVEGVNSSFECELERPTEFPVWRPLRINLDLIMSDSE